MASGGLLLSSLPTLSPPSSFCFASSYTSSSSLYPTSMAASMALNDHRGVSCRLGGRSGGGTLSSSLPSRLRSNFLDAWEGWKSSTPSRRCHKRASLIIVDEIAGQYEETFDDVDKHLLNYFTFKAVKTVLAQLYEMNPGQYLWFYGFVGNNKPHDGKHFLRLLVKERQELGERVMVTRLHLFNTWVKKYNHSKMHKYISDDNLDLLRERLIQTVKFPSEDFKSGSDDAIDTQS